MKAVPGGCGGETAAIKHTVPGDVNIATAAEVAALMRDGGSGRVRR